MLRSRIARYISYVFLFVLVLSLMGANSVFAEEKPTISSFTPATGGKGTSVVITGTNLTGATAVSFGTVAAASFKVDSATQITATVGTGNSGDVSVTTPGGTATRPGFLFTRFELQNRYPVLSGTATDSYSSYIEINYQGSDKKRFNLNATPPKDWYASIQSSSGVAIAALEIGPAAEYGTTETVSVRFGPLYPNTVQPGDYITTLQVNSGDLKSSIDLTAKVTARYSLTLTIPTGIYSTQATAGSDNHFGFQVYNDGSANLESVTFSSTNPTEWTIKFDPPKIDSISPGVRQNVDVIINPPKGKTIAGDYMIGITASAKNGRDDADIRVTVLSPSIWGWVGIIIVLLVIAGLGVIFRVLGRR